MPDSFDNQSTPPTAPPSFTPVQVPPQSAAAPPPKSGSSALKIILIVLAVFVCIGIAIAGVVSYGIYRLAHAVHQSNNGQISIHTPGGGFSANTEQSVSASDLGIAIYPGALQAKGTLRMTIAGKSIVTANFLTSDSRDQVFAFYKDTAGPDAQTMSTGDSAEVMINKSTESTTITILPASGSDQGKTQITIVHTTGSSSN